MSATPNEQAQASAIPVAFTEVVQAEWSCLQERRLAAGPKGIATDDPTDIAGIALSGGGIRSATFCLGVLQALARRRVLHGFDYLSTVSGGGFVGSWLSAWIVRRANPGYTDDIPQIGVPPVAADAAQGYQEPFALRHVRLYGNYLTPRKGTLSADTWRAATVIVRNLFFTWSALVPLLIAAAFGAELMFGSLARGPSAAALVCAPPTAELQPLAQQAATAGAPAALEAICAARHTAAWKTRLSELALPAAAIAGLLLILSLTWLLYGEGGGFMGLVGVLVALGVTGGISLVWIDWIANEKYRLGELIAGVLVLLVLAYAAYRGNQTRHSTLATDEWRERLVHFQASATVCLVVGGGILAIMALGPHATTWLVAHSAHGAGADLGKRIAAWGGIATAAASAIGIGVKAAPTGAGERGRTDVAGSGKTTWALGLAPVVVLVALLVLASALADTVVRAVATDGQRRIVVFIGIVGALVWCGFALYELATDAPTANVPTDQEQGNATTRSWTMRERASTKWGVVTFCVGATAAVGLLTLVSPRAGLLVLALAAVLAAYQAWHVSGPPVARIGTLAIGLTVAAVLAYLWRAGGATSAPAPIDIVLPWFAGFVAALLLAPLWHAQSGNARSYWLSGSALLVLAGFALVAYKTSALDSGDAVELAIWHRADAALGLLVAAVTIVIGVGWMADPNELSLHAFYRDRLVRAYLGASNPDRESKEIGAEVPHAADDVLLSQMTGTQKGGPYHLINTTLNLVGGHDLTTAQRSSDCFTLAQSHCGSSATGYRPTATYMAGAMTLGTAVAVSGAAASPTMGAKTPSSAVTLLMSLLNVRLGFWAPNPRGRRWTKRRPRLWPFFMLRESLSQTNALGPYCYLTDGGHFDNTALYSLVQRGCTSIVVVDCGADPKPCFSDLGDVVRRCRIDFGAEINLDLSPLDPLSGVPVSHFAKGYVRYAQTHLDSLAAARGGSQGQKAGIAMPAHTVGTRNEVVGTIVWLKPSVGAPTDPADVRQYGKENQGFPQQATTNQWFDEAQFESYRRLGEETGITAFPDPEKPLETTAAVRRYFVQLPLPVQREDQALRRLGNRVASLPALQARATLERLGTRIAELLGGDITKAPPV